MNQLQKDDENNISISNIEPLMKYSGENKKQKNSIYQQLEYCLLKKQRHQWKMNCMFLLTQCIIDFSYGLDELRMSQNNENDLDRKTYLYLISFSSIELVLILLLFWITNFLDHKISYWKQYMTIISFLLLFGQVEIMIQLPKVFMIKFLTIYLIFQSICIRQVIIESSTYKFCLFCFLSYVIIRHQILLNFNVIILVYTLFVCGFMMFCGLKGDINQDSFLQCQQLIFNLPELRAKHSFNFDSHAYNVLPPNFNFLSNTQQLFQPKSKNNKQQQPINFQSNLMKRNPSVNNENQNNDPSTSKQERLYGENIPSIPPSATFPKPNVNQIENSNNAEQHKAITKQINQERIFRFPQEILGNAQKSCSKQFDASHFSPSINYQSQTTQHLNQIYVDILSLIPQGIALINHQREVVIANTSILNHFKCKSDEELISKIFSINQNNFIQKSETPSNQTINSPVSIKRGNTLSSDQSNNNNTNMRFNRNSSFSSSAARESLMSKKNSVHSDKLSIQKDRRASILSQFKLKEMQSKRLSISHNKRQQISELFDEILSQDLNSQYFENNDGQEKNNNGTTPRRRKSMNFKLGMNRPPFSIDEHSKDHSFQFTVEKNVIQYTFHQGEKTFSLKIICCEMQQQSQTNIPSPLPTKTKKVSNNLGSPFSLNGQTTQNQIYGGVEPAILIITEDISNKILLQKLERLNKQKKRMVASISHELRTPLNCSIGLLDLLLQHPQMPSDLLQEYLLPALYSNRLLFNIVNDIIDFSQIDSGKFQLSFKIFDLRQLLEECAMLMKISVSRKNLKLTLDIDENIPNCINSDPQRIRQIILNLLSNAVKYTFKGYIKIEAVNVDSKYIQIKVIDSGIGIKEESMNQIFEQFGRIQEEKVLETEGAGLGLTISMNLAKGVGGNRGIDVKSTFGKGSTFSFFILKQEFKKKGASMTKKEIFNKSMYQVISHTQGMNSVELKDLSIDDENQNNTNDNSSLVSGLNGTSQGSIMVLDSHKNGESTTKSSKEIQIQSNKVLEQQINPSKGLLNIPTPVSQLNKTMSQSSFTSAVANENVENKEYTINKPEIQDVVMSGPLSYMSSISKQQSRQHEQNDQVERSNLSPNAMINDLILKIQRRDSIKQHSQITETSKEYENGGSFSDSFRNRSRNQIYQYSPGSAFTEEESKRSPNKDSFRLEMSPPKIIINQLGLSKKIKEYNDEESSPDYLKVQGTNHLESSFTSQEQDGIEQQISSGVLANSKKSKTKQTQNQMKKVDCYEEFKSMSKNHNKKVNQMNEVVMSKQCKCNQILIAEDNEFNLFLLKKILQTCNLEVDSAMNGQEAIDKVIERFSSPCQCKNGYKLIFMDIDMPIKNGYEASQEIIKYCNSNDLKPPLISACSAYVGEEDKKQALKEGMTYFITKPIEMKVIQSVLKKAKIIT